MRKATLILTCVLVQTVMAYHLSEVFNFPEWTATNNWFINGGEKIRANGLKIGPNETIVYCELVSTETSERLRYWMSREAFLKVGDYKLPFMGEYIDGKLQWLTEEDGSVTGWGWNNPEVGKSY